MRKEGREEGERVSRLAAREAADNAVREGGGKYRAQLCRCGGGGGGLAARTPVNKKAAADLGFFIPIFCDIHIEV
jgi:hypothetical protein